MPRSPRCQGVLGQPSGGVAVLALLHVLLHGTLPQRQLSLLWRDVPADEYEREGQQ